MIRALKNYTFNKLAKALKPYITDGKNEQTDKAEVLEIKDGKVRRFNLSSSGNSLLPEQNITPEEANKLLSLSFQRKADFKITTAPQGGKYALDADFTPSTPAMFGLDGIGRDIIYAFYAKHGFIGWQICAMLSQHWLINRCCRIPNEDALSCGYDLHLNKETETDEEKKQNQKFIKDLESYTQKHYKLHEKLLKWGFNRSVYGVGLAYFVIDGEDPATPLNLDGIKPNSFKGISVVEPYWAVPEFSGNEVTTPGSVNFYKPQFYNIGGQRVHISRLCVKVFSEVPDILKPSYYYGGIPLSQMLYERVYAAEKTCNEGPELALSKRTFILRTDLDGMVEDPDPFMRKIQMMTKVRNNNGIWCIDRTNQESVEQLETTLSGLDGLTSEMYKYAAAVAGIPDNRLYAKSINGMASTGENEIKNYSQTLKTYQENCFDEFLIKAYTIAAKSDFNKVVDLDLTFKPIDTPTEAELAATQQQKTGNYTALISGGIISAEEARQALKADEHSGFNDIDAELPEQLDLESLGLQAEQPQEQLNNAEETKPNIR